MGKKQNRDKNKGMGLDALRALYDLEPVEDKKPQVSYTLIEDKRKSNKNRGRVNQGYGNGNSNEALGNPTTPYNFVQLNKAIVESPIMKHVVEGNDLQGAYKKFLLSSEKFSGYFKVEINNLTPLYIEGTNGVFSDGKNICIPGSSLRGCLKNVFKIITESGFKSDENPDYTDRHLYYRGMASAYKPIRDIYADEMVQTIMRNGETSQKSAALGGFLVKKGKCFYVCPASFDVIKTDVTKANPNKGTVEWNGLNEAYIYTGKMISSRMDNGVKKDTSKRHYYKIYNPKWDILYEVSENLLQGYLSDKNRKGLSLLDPESLEKNNLKEGLGKSGHGFEYIIPCFYVKDGQGAVKHFGAGPYYRIPYNMKISDHVPDGLKKDVVDFTDAIFGNKDTWASRVYFEDAYSENGKKVEFYEKSYVRILMGPNPTSFQFYLEPNEKGNASHWNTKANLRGYKFYWHKKADWIGEKNENMNKQISPIKEGHTFVGKVRFKNLSAEELGALAYLFFLSEKEDCAYKLGMGKSLGLGSIKLKATLYLQDKDYYRELFKGDAFNQGSVEKEKEEFVNTFEVYMKNELQAISSSEYALYQARMEELKLIMATSSLNKGSQWTEATKYMDINNKDEKKVINKRVALKTIKETLKKNK